MRWSPTKHKFGSVTVVANSPGGGVSEYGLMYCEMERLRNCGLRLVACIDTVGASGGMLQVLPAHEIVAAPFAMVGSIGVVSEFLNFHDMLRSVGIRPVTLTAGKFKRTVTPMSEIEPEARRAL